MNDVMLSPVHEVLQDDGADDEDAKAHRCVEEIEIFPKREYGRVGAMVVSIFT